MSQENVELVRREYVAFSARDWGTLSEIWHPEIEYEALDPATYRGHDEMRQGFMGWSEMSRSGGSKPEKWSTLAIRWRWRSDSGAAE
jgi:ketosteroid isomerase-like protein